MNAPHAVTILLFIGLSSGTARPETRTPRRPTTAAELFVDPPTLRCLGFRWRITGEDHANATVALSYQHAGEVRWHDGLPMLRVHREIVDRDGTPYTCGNLFAGSLLNLEQGTEYVVRLQFSGTDGTKDVRTLRCRTRSAPPVARGERTLHVYASGTTGARSGLSFTSIAAAANEARPGDVVLIHAGTHRGPVFLPRSGTAERPITFRGAGDGEAILRGPGDTGNVVEASGRDYVTLERLTIEGGHTGIKANGCKGLVVRNCRLGNVASGIVTYATDAAEWYIADNTIMGRVQKWYPRVDSSDTGINCCGSGHVICHNRVRRFWDCISTDNCGGAKAEWASAVRPPQVAIDIYGNDCSEALDDGIEADYTLHNVRVFENRVMNVHTGISAQPTLGGPLYLFRNVVYNTTNTPLKLHNYPAGLAIYHNTLIGAGQAFQSYPPAWQNGTIRNNLFLGTRGYAVETGSQDPRTTMDYDGFRRTPGSTLVIKWSGDGGKTWDRFATLLEFARATRHEAHGTMIDYDQFERAAPPQEGRTYPPSDIDLRLRAGSAAVDAGCRIPTVNDRFHGRAPDLGAIESGDPPPVFGPREGDLPR